MLGPFQEIHSKFPPYHGCPSARLWCLAAISRQGRQLSGQVLAAPRPTFCKDAVKENYPKLRSIKQKEDGKSSQCHLGALCLMALVLWCVIKYIFGSSSVPSTESQKLLEFPKWGEWWKYLYVNEVTFGLHIRMGEPILIRWLELLLPSPNRKGVGAGRGWRFSSITKGQWFSQSHLCNETSRKRKKIGFGELRSW